MIDLTRIFDREERSLVSLIRNDPVEFLHLFEADKDIEIVGFLASQFAYGRIDVLKRFLRTLLTQMRSEPYDYVKSGDFSSLQGLYYRFQKTEHLSHLFVVLRRIVAEYGGIGGLLQSYFQGDIRETLWAVRRILFRDDEGLTFFFPKPSAASALKRWSLYLRWMVRQDEVDRGIWGFVDKGTLVVPLDTHLFKIGRCLGWTTQANATWKAAREITEALKVFSPEDPLKYDFFLCHKIGIGAGCTGRRTPACQKRCLLAADDGLTDEIRDVSPVVLAGFKQGS
jgi:uncharacterized protein (TIGR02757 family)